jgi:hypothetical protein
VVGNQRLIAGLSWKNRLMEEHGFQQEANVELPFLVLVETEPLILTPLYPAIILY